jgi:hypothetical protein
MAGWGWLTKPAYSWRFVRNVLLKTTTLFIGLNLLYAALNPLPGFSQLTFYNSLLPGRERLPFAENPADAYSISLHRLEGIFASHRIAHTQKQEDEFRVIALGDSGVWGWLLDNDQTLTACLNRGNYLTPDGRTMRVYNLGYPVTSVLKDALILQQALRYRPDAVLWLTTLQALYKDEQLRHPIMRNNQDLARAFIEQYELDLNTNDLPAEPGFWRRTIIGHRRELADLLRHQIYGIAWMVTGVDHTNPKFFEARIENLLAGEDIPTRGYIEVGGDLKPYLSFDVIGAAITLAGEAGVPVLLVNEPIFRTSGVNKETRYNDLYPRWAYDDYRRLLNNEATAHGWHYLDEWEAVPNDQFTDYPLHYTPVATCEFAGLLAPEILRLIRQR